METEADLPEPLAVKKREGEIVYPASGHFDSTAYETSPGELKLRQGALHVPPEAVEYSGETENTQAANDVGAEAMDTVIKVNVETLEGEKLLGSPSAFQVSNEDTCRVSKNSEPEEVTLQTGNETLNDGKQTKNNTNMEVAKEIGTEENKVTEDSEEQPDENNMRDGIVNLTGTSLHTAQVKESSIMIEEKSLKEERIIDQVEVVGDQHVLVEDKITEKEKSEHHNYEKDGTITGGNTDLASNEQVVNVLEAKSDHNKDDLIHTPDPMLISLNKSVQTVMEPCNKAESTIEGKPGEEMRKTSPTQVENKEAEKSSNLTNEVPEATKQSERVADEKVEKEESMYKVAEDIIMSTTDIQSNEEATLDTREGDSEMFDKPSVTVATDVSGVYEAESEAAEKLKETSSILSEEKSKDETKPSKDEMNHENSVDTPAMQTEVQDKEQIEMTEKSAANDSTSNETGKDYEIPDQKGDGLFMKDEDALSVKEVLPAKEAPSGEHRYEEESTVTVTKDSITEIEIIDAFEHSQSGMTNPEDRPEDLQQEKPEKEKLEGSLNIVAEELSKAAETEYAEAITSVKEETPIKSHEESLEKEMKSNLPHHTDADVLEIELNEKTECAEFEAPNKNANGLHDIQALDEDTGQTDGKNLHEIFNSEPKGTSQEAYEAYEEKDKHIEDAPEACQSSNSTIFKHTSIEGAESTELIPKASETETEKLKETSGLDFGEKSVIMDDEENTDQEMQKNKEACDSVTQEILANSIDAEASVEVDNAVFLRAEKADKNIQVESPLELAPELTGQDESYIAEDNESRSSTNEEVNDGTKITGSVVAIDEQVIAGSVTHISTESIEKPNVESSEGNKNMAEQSQRENSGEQVTEDNSIKCLALESVEHGPVKNLEEDSTREIFKKSDTAEATESVENETIKNIESPREIAGASTVKGDTLQTEGRNPTPTQTVTEKNGNDFGPVDVKDDIENKTSKFEEDLEYISQKNEPGEKLPQILSTMSDKNEASNADADKTLGDVEEGPTQNLEEALQIEEEKETEVKSDTKDSKTANEDLEKISEISDSSKSKESMVSEPSSEMNKMMVEVEIKKEESEEIYEDSNDGGKDEKTEKHNIKEECSTTDISQEPIGEKTLQISNKDEKEEETPRIQEEDDEKQTLVVEKNVEQSSEVEEEKIERSSQEDDIVAEISKQGNDTYISALSREVEEEKIEQSSQEDEKVVEISIQGNVIEQETFENSEDNINKAEKSEEENNGQQIIEENYRRGLMPESESVEQSPVKNLEVDKMEADKSSGEIFGNSETSGTAEPESNEHETSTTIESTAEVLDTSQMKQGDSLQKEDNQLTAIESLAEDKRDEDKGPTMMAEENSENELLAVKDNIETKPLIDQEDSQHIPQETEPEENHEQSVTVRSDENEAFISNADKTPCLMEVLTSQDLNEAPWKEDTDKETEEKNDTKDNQTPTEENLELVAEPSDASKSTESIVSELKSEKDQMLVQDEMKEEPEDEELYDDSKNSGSREPTKDKSPQSFEEEGKEEDTPIPEACVELEISVGEDAEKQINEGISAAQSEELEEEKVEQISKEDDITAKTSKQEECEITQTANEDEDTGSQNIEKGGADENEFEQFARGIDNDVPLVKESEETEHDKQAFEAEASSKSIEKQGIEKQSKQGASSSLAEEENVEENSKEDESTAMKLKDQDLEKNSEISDASKCKESMISKPSSETDKMMVEDEIKNEEYEHLHEDSKDGGKDEETEKHNIKEECSTIDNLPEPIGEESLESSKEEETPEIQASEELKTRSASEDAEEQTLKVEKTVDWSKAVEEEEIEQSSQEDDMVAEMTKQSNDTYISPVSNEQETLENSVGNKDKEEKSVEESNSRGLITESVEPSPVKNIEDDKPREDKSSGEILENFKTSGVAEITAHEMRTTFENTTEINDTSLLKQEDSVQNEEKNLTATESSAEENRNEDRCLVMLAEENSNDNEPITAEDNIEKKPSIGVEDLRHIHHENEPEEKSNTKDNKIATEESHEIVAESSDARKSTEVLYLKSEEDKMLVRDEIKEEESKELYEDTNNAVICDTEDIVQHSKQKASSSFVEQGHVKENSREDESTPMESKYQVDVSNSLIQDIEAPSSAEGTISETLKDGEESKVNSYPLDITEESEAEILPEETNGSLIEESARVSHTSNKESEEEIKEKEGTAVDDSDSAPIIVETEEKSLQEAESEEKKQVESFAPAFEENDRAEIETKETMLERIDINVKPDDTSDLGEKRGNEIPTVADKAREITEGLIQESAMVSHTSNKETEEEIKKTEETTTEDSDSASVAVVTEIKGLQEAESEDKRLLESFGPALEEKGIAETEIKERTLGSVDINVKPEDTSDLGEKRDKEIPKVADEDREIIDCEVQNDASHAGSKYQSEETAEVSESVHKPPAQEEVLFENTETASVAQAKDETFMNKQDNTTYPVNVSELESVDTRKETANEEVQKHKTEDLDKATDLSMSEDVEITKGEETGKLADHGDVCKSTAVKDFESSNLELQMEKTEGEKPFDEALKTSETSGICTESEKVILEQEIFKDNLKEVDEVEGAAIEQKGEALTEEIEVAETQTSKKFPESDKSKIEENSSNNQNQEDDKEIKEKEEPRLEAEEHKEQNVNETTKAVILTEKEQDGVELSNDSEDIKEMVIEEPQDCYNKIDNASLTAEEVTEAENFPDGKEFVSMKLEETSELVETEGVTLENRDAGELEETKIAFEESKGQNVEKAEVGKSQTVENPGPDEVEETKIVANEVNEIKEVSDAVYESKDRGTEEAEVEESHTVEKPDQLSTHNHDHAEKVYAATENSDADETKIVSNSVDETNDQGAKEAEMGKIPSGYFEHAQKESVPVENPEADQVNEIKVASDATYEFKDQDTVEYTTEIPAVEKLDQVPAANSEHAEEETVTVQYLDAEVEETKIVSILASKSKDDVTGENKTEEKPDAEKIEEACKAASDYRAPVTENEITADDQAPSAEKSNSQLPTPTSEDEIQYDELSVETAEKATAHVAAEYRCIEDSHQVTKESFPDKFETKEAGESAIKLDPKSLGQEINYGSGKVETTTPPAEGSSMEISQKDRKIIQETRELEQSPCATTEKQIMTEVERPLTTLEQPGITETPQKAEVGDLEPGNTKAEAKLNLEGEQTTEESALMDSAKASLPDLLPRSSEGRETTTASTEENQTKEAEAIHVEEAKMDEDSSSDPAAPVMVEATRDVVDVKAAHKKSHNILSSVGSKVKHSISKVKKVITGKSSHPKPVSPK